MYLYNVGSSRGFKKDITPVIPSLHTILTQINWTSAEIDELFPRLSSLTIKDVRQAYVLQRLQRLLAENTVVSVLVPRSSTVSPSPKKSHGGGNPSQGQPFSLTPEGEVFSQVILTHYSLWLRDAVRRKNIHLGQYIYEEVKRHLSSYIMRGSGLMENVLVPSSPQCPPVTSAATSCGGIVADGTKRIRGLPGGVAMMRHDSSIAASPAWSAICYRQVCAELYLTQDSQQILHVLMLLMSSQSSPLIRARCMKALGGLVRTDASLLYLPRLQEMVLERFNDVSISVREETVKLVGKYLLSLRPDQLKSKKEAPLKAQITESTERKGDSSDDRYLNGLLVRLRDKGVSVRKSVAQILREILLHQPDHPRYTELCR